jgi:RNA polymerase sigma factor (sigma-70 family)
LLSEVFLDVWQRAAPFEGRSSVSTWLISIARFKALSAHRRRADAPLDETIEGTVADTANDPEVALQEKDRGELLRQALTRLSPEDREIIDLVYYHEKLVDECAHILGIPAATVKTRMFYVRKKLAELVHKDALQANSCRLGRTFGVERDDIAQDVLVKILLACTKIMAGRYSDVPAVVHRMLQYRMIDLARDSFSKVERLGDDALYTSISSSARWIMPCS